ncbi:MAG: hypothetical protein U0W65_14815 [Bacteroidia bacterium]
MKQHNSTVDSSKIHFQEFKIVKGQIDCPEEFSIESIEGHNYNIDFRLAFNLEDNLVKADFNLTVDTKSENKEEAKAVFHLLYIFQVENLKDFASLTEDGKIDLDSRLGITLASMSHSTSRGVFLTRFQGTALQRFVLPVVNPKDLLQSSIEAESEE